MGLSAELARPLPRVPHPFLRKRSALAAEAEKLSQLFGGVPREVEPPPRMRSPGLKPRSARTDPAWVVCAAAT